LIPEGGRPGVHSTDTERDDFLLTHVYPMEETALDLEGKPYEEHPEELVKAFLMQDADRWRKCFCGCSCIKHQVDREVASELECKDSLFCSETCATVLQDGNFLSKNKHANRYLPKDFGDGHNSLLKTRTSLLLGCVLEAPVQVVLTVDEAHIAARRQGAEALGEAEGLLAGKSSPTAVVTQGYGSSAAPTRDAVVGYGVSAASPKGGGVVIEVDAAGATGGGSRRFSAAHHVKARRMELEKVFKLFSKAMGKFVPQKPVTFTKKEWQVLSRAIQTTRKEVCMRHCSAPATPICRPNMPLPGVALPEPP